MTQHLEGYAELTKKLRLLSTPKEYISTLRASVRTPMKSVMKQSQVAIGKISPGKRQLHKTYKGRLVSAGFASRNLRLIVVTGKGKESATAILGVRKEAYYALQFFELGTAYIQRQPWLRPTFHAMRTQTVNGMGTVLKKWIDKIAKRRGA